MDDGQLILDFSSRLAERLAALRGLERAFSGEIGPERAAGLVEVLQRVAICSPSDGGASRARVAYLAGGLSDRRKVDARTVRRWSRDAEAAGVLVVSRLSQQFGGHATNEWAIQWARVRELLAAARSVSGVMSDPIGVCPVAATGGRVRAGHGADTGRTRAGHGADIMPGPGADIMPGLTVVALVDKSTGPDRVPDRAVESDSLDSIIADSVDLSPLSGVLVESLPVNSLGCGNAFAVLTERHLSDLPVIFEWYRRALSLSDPLFRRGDLAECALVLAAARWAARLPADRVRRSRVGAFVSAVVRGRWRQGARYVRAVVEELERLGLVAGRCGEGVARG